MEPGGDLRLLFSCLLSRDHLFLRYARAPRADIRLAEERACSSAYTGRPAFEPRQKEFGHDAHDSLTRPLVTSTIIVTRAYIVGVIIRTRVAFRPGGSDDAVAHQRVAAIVVRRIDAVPAA